MAKKIIGGIGLTLLLFVVLVVALLFPPWAETQRGRWFYSAFEGLRADHFSNWNRVLPYRSIPASTHPRSYEKAPLDLSEVSIDLDGRQETLADYIRNQDIVGLMVLQDGKIRFEHYSHDIDAKTRFHIWSSSKSFTATLIAMALHEGRIDSLNDPIEKYAPQFRGTAYGEVTLNHLLMMSSGVDFKHFNYEPDRNDFYRDVVLKRQSISDWAAQLKRRVPQGTDFNYLATDTHVLSTALTAVYDKPLAQILSEKLWEPGGFTSDALWSQDADGDRGVALGHCCLAITLTDFAHLGQLYLEGLQMSGRQTVDEKWFDLVSTPRADFQEPPAGTDGDVFGYSYQFWLPPAYDQEFVARGAFGQELWIDRKRGFVVAQFSTGENHVSGEYVRMMRAIGDAVSN